MDPVSTTDLAAAWQLPCVVNCKVVPEELAPPSVPVTSVTIIKSHMSPTPSLALSSRTTMNIIAISDPEPADRRDEALVRTSGGFRRSGAGRGRGEKSARRCPPRRSPRCLRSRRASAAARRAIILPILVARIGTCDRDRARTFGAGALPAAEREVSEQQRLVARER